MPLVSKVLLGVSASVTFRHSVQGHEIPLPAPLCFSAFWLHPAPTHFFHCLLGLSWLLYSCLSLCSLTHCNTCQHQTIITGCWYIRSPRCWHDDRAGLNEDIHCQLSPARGWRAWQWTQDSQKTRLAKQPPKRDAIKDTFDYKKYFKFLNDKRYHKLRKQRGQNGGNIFNTSSRQKGKCPSYTKSALQFNKKNRNGPNR